MVTRYAWSATSPEQYRQTWREKRVGEIPVTASHSLTVFIDRTPYLVDTLETLETRRSV